MYSTHTAHATLLLLVSLTTLSLGCGVFEGREEPGEVDIRLALGTTFKVHAGLFIDDSLILTTKHDPTSATINDVEAFQPDILDVIAFFDKPEDFKSLRSWELQGPTALLQTHNKGIGVVEANTLQGERFKLTFEVAEAATTKLWSDGGPRVIQGYTLEISSNSQDAQGRLLLGNDLPVLVSGGGADIDHNRITFHDAPALYTIEPIAEGEPLEIQTFPIAAIDELSVEQHNERFFIKPRVKGNIIEGGADTLNVTVLSKDTCEVLLEGTVITIQSTHAEAKPCTFELTLPGANKGQGLTRLLLYKP